MRAPSPSAVLGALRHRRQQRRLAAPRLLRAFADAYPEAVFVEIGSNDGEQHDHLRPFVLSRPWRGVMVEPVPHVVERLRRNYGALDRVVLENAAVAGHDGTIPFFYPQAPASHETTQLPDWYDGIGSLSRMYASRSLPSGFARKYPYRQPGFTIGSNVGLVTARLIRPPTT